MRAFWTTVLAISIAACATSSAPSASMTEDQSVCPGTIAETVGAACDVEGEVCYPEYACGIAPALATCVCTAGSFVCKDVLDASLGADSTPGCPSQPPTPTCPSTMTSANNAACTQSGQICTYASPCASIPAYLDCVCMPLPQIDGGTYLGFSCDDDLCLPDASTPIDSAIVAPDTGAGSVGPDATIAAGKSPDASAPDAGFDASVGEASDASGG